VPPGRPRPGRQEAHVVELLGRLGLGGEQRHAQAQGERHDAPNGPVPHCRLLTSVSCPSSFSVEGRDRTAARATLGGEFPTLALPLRWVGPYSNHRPSSPRPPSAPGGWASPTRVLPLPPRRSPPNTARILSAPPHPPRHSMVCFHGRSIVPRPYIVRVLLKP